MRRLLPFFPPFTLLFVLFLLLVPSCSQKPSATAASKPGSAQPLASIGAAPSSPPASPLEARLGKIRARLHVLAADHFGFWKTHGPDREQGAFHGTLDRKGNPIAPTDKGLIQEARHLWSTSLWYERRERTPEIKALSDDLYRFLIAHFYDPGAKDFFFKVSRTGKPVETKKVLYANAFAIYALTEYARVYDVKEAGDYALAAFRTLDARAHDKKYGGYDQTRDPAWLSPGAQRETNTHLHLMEAFTALYAYDKDPLVKARLEELVGIFLTKILQKEGYARKEFLLDWTPFGAPVVSYGHDLETGWLLVEAAEALGRPNDPAILAAAQTLGGRSAAWGFDTAQGGYFEEGVPGGAPTKLEKIWWIQAEALPGLYWLYELSEDATYLDRLEQTLTWIEEHQRDKEYGAWFWGVLADGTVGPHGDNKGEEWKASYHELRALVFTEDWIARRPRAPRDDRTTEGLGG